MLAIARDFPPKAGRNNYLCMQAYRQAGLPIGRQALLLSVAQKHF